LADLKSELRSLSAQTREMFQLRWELARLELQADLQNVKRLAVIGGLAAVMALTSLPLLACFLAEKLDGWHGIDRAGWLLVFGLALLFFALIAAYGGWRWFRRRFVGLQETLEELREDVEWAKEGMMNDE
jgi:uncharacterized membrane protein YqjE